MIPLIIVVVFISLLLLYVYSPLKRPFLTESDWTTHKFPLWQLYYSSRYFCPVRRPARNSGFEELFAADMGPDPDREALQGADTIMVKAVGDLMCRRDMVGVGGAGLYDEVGKELFSGDLHIGNLEFAVNPKWVIEKLLRYSVPPSHAEPLLEDKRFGRFDVLTLANNHINDSLSAGIQSTCEYLDSRGFKRVGANRTIDEQDQFPIIECKGAKIAVLSYTFSTNGIPLEQKYGTNHIRFNALNDEDYDPTLIFHHIKLARERGADFIIASNHWGVEFEYYPSVRLVKRAHELLDAGIDLIVGHHPHILNFAERYKTKDNRDGFICYSLGNLTSFGLIIDFQRMSEIAEITLETGYNKEGKRIVRIGETKLTPVIHTRNKKGKTVFHKLLPIIPMAEMVRAGTGPTFLSYDDKRLLKKLDTEHKKHFRQKGIRYS
jgi:poly-gamma-glutamate synthesis protein (capsule biosynthesis protein)